MLRQFTPGVSCCACYTSGKKKFDTPQIILERKRILDNMLLRNTYNDLLQKYSIRRNIEIDDNGREKKKYFKCSRCQRKVNNSGYGKLHHRNDMLIIEHKVHRNGQIELHEIGYCKEFGCAAKYKSHQKRVGGLTY